MVPKAVPLMRASEMRTMSLTPAAASFSGSAGSPPPACRGLGTGILQHQDVVRPDVEIGIVDAAPRVVERGNTTARAVFSNRRGVGGGALEDRAFGGELAVQRDEPALRLTGLSAGRMTDGSMKAGPAKTLAERLAGDGLATRSSSGPCSRSSRAEAAGGGKSSM